MKRGYLILENGQIFEGERFGGQGEAHARLIGNTSMIADLEVIGDPRNAGHIVMMTFPLVGNYGVIEEDIPTEPSLKALIVRDVCASPSNFRQEKTVDEYLKARGVIGLYGIDTRALMHVLREQGEMGAAILDEVPGDLDALTKALREAPCAPFAGNGRAPKTLGQGAAHAIVMDFGMGEALAQRIADNGFRATVVPGDIPVDALLELAPDAVALSDGPGDAATDPRTETVKALVAGSLPVFGVGYGHLLAARALGHALIPLKLGHRGGNQPVRRIADGRLFITAQNHGHVANVPQDQRAYENVNDRTCAGLLAHGGRVTTVAFDPGSLPPSECAALIQKSLTGKED